MFSCVQLHIHAALYPSTGYRNELAWAALWLYRATGNGTYLTAARTQHPTNSVGFRLR